MTLDQAIRRAHRRAKKTGEVRFVVLENGYHVATDEDTVTFFQGAPVVYCTADQRER